MSKSVIILIVAATFFLLCGPGCHEAVQKGGRIINDFETDADLDNLNWKCRTLFTLSSDHVTHGNRSLAVTFHPSMYPGTSFKKVPENWKDYKFLAVEIFNPESQGPLSVTLRVDDKGDTPEYNDRYNLRIELQPGINHIRIPLESLKTPENRPLDLGHIHALLIYLVNPQETKVIYLDYLRLEGRVGKMGNVE